MQRAFSAVVVTFALSTSMFAHGQVVGPAKPKGPDSSSETQMYDVYQHIFNLLFSTRSSYSDDAKKKSVIAFFISLGLDEKAANDLFPYVMDGLDQQKIFTQRKIADLCKARSDIKSKSQIGDFGAALYEDLDRMQKRIWGNFNFLDVKNRKILSAYAMKKSLEVSIQPTDARAIMARTPETLEQVLQRFCKVK
jgi:hypothetical protein